MLLALSSLAAGAGELVVQDAGEEFVGRLLHGFEAGAEVTVLREESGTLLPLLIGAAPSLPNTPYSRYRLRYETPACVGESALPVPATLSHLLGGVVGSDGDGTLWRSEQPEGEPPMFASESTFDNVQLQCEISPLVAPAWTGPEPVLDLLGFEPPFSLHFEQAALVELNVVDNVGSLVGRLFHAAEGSHATVLRPLGGSWMPLHVELHPSLGWRVYPDQHMYYAEPGCRGERALPVPGAWGHLTGVVFGRGDDNVVYRSLPPEGAPPSFAALSVSLLDGGCIDTTANLLVWGEPQPVLDLKQLVPPFGLIQGAPLLFEDGFESGDTARWAQTVD